MLKLIVLTLSLSIAAPSWAALRSPLYAEQTLAKVQQSYGKNLEAMLFQDIRVHLSQAELATLSRVELLIPSEGEYDPFLFAASPLQAQILAPAASIKFFDELAIASAWFERFGCDKQVIFDYLAAIDHSELELAPPLAALGLPARAYEQDAYVDDVSQKTLKPALAFIMLHELAHIHLQHRGYHQLSSAEAQQQEAEADSFALQVMRRMQLPPYGMAFWFAVVSSRDPLSDQQDYQTHPLSAERLRLIADSLRQSPQDFIELANRGTLSESDILQVAEQIEVIANTTADPQVRQLLRQRGAASKPEQLRLSCPKPS